MSIVSQSLDGLKACNRCCETKPLSDFYADKQNKDGRQGKCIPCFNIVSKSRYQQNKDRILAQAKESRDANIEQFRAHRTKYRASIADKNCVWQSDYRKNNRDQRLATIHNYRAKSKGCSGTLTAEDVAAARALSCGRCLSCGFEGALTLDHVIPLVDNGPNTRENLQFICASCNCRKRNKRTDYRSKD